MPTPERDPGAGLQEQLLTAGGRRFRAVRAGSGTPTVVFESGLSASASEWVAVQRAVGQRTATLSYDRAGYGGSAPSTDGRLLTDLAADLEAVLQAAGVTGPVVLVGHSWGCPIIRTFAQTTSRELAGIVLVDGTVSAVMDDKEAARATTVFGLVAKVAPLGLHRRLMMLSLKGARGVLSDEDNALVLRDMLGKRDVRAAAREAQGLKRVAPDLLALEAQGFPAGVPVTFVMGALPDRGQQALRDRFLAATRAEADRLGARYVVGERSTHFVPQQEPQLVADEVLALVGG